MRATTCVFVTVIASLTIVFSCIRPSNAQAPARGTVPRSAPRPEANLAQVMRGILFPNSNVIFAAQSHDPDDVKPDADPTTATNPLAGSFGGWQAVENSGLALEESAALLTVPNRVCSNGKPVPLQNADWNRFVQGLREAGATTYKAAQSKNQDTISDAADRVVIACQNCHMVYREKTPEQGGLAARCTK